MWQRLVYITVGELELTKSSYATMLWKLKEGKEIMCNTEDNPCTLNLRSEKYKGLKVELTRNYVDTVEIQLGVRLIMNGEDSNEFLYRLEQSNILAGITQTSYFFRQDVERIYRERWISPVGYYLTVTKFSDKQCKTIQSPTYNTLLLNMEFNRQILRAVTFGPKQHQGNRIVDHTTTQ